MSSEPSVFRLRVYQLVSVVGFSKHRWLYRDVELPSVPRNGDAINFNRDAFNDEPIVLEYVTYYAPAGRFVAFPKEIDARSETEFTDTCTTLLGEKGWQVDEDPLEEKIRELASQGRVEVVDEEALQRMDLENPDFTITKANVYFWGPCGGASDGGMSIHWSTVSGGFGTCEIYGKNARLRCDSECMSREFVRSLLEYLLSQMEFDDAIRGD